MVSEEINISVSKLPGGFMINHSGGLFIETSLNKTIAFVKEMLSQEVAPRVPAAE